MGQVQIETFYRGWAASPGFSLAQERRASLLAKEISHRVDKSRQIMAVQHRDKTLH